MKNSSFKDIKDPQKGRQVVLMVVGEIRWQVLVKNVDRKYLLSQKSIFMTEETQA